MKLILDSENSHPTTITVRGKEITLLLIESSILIDSSQIAKIFDKKEKTVATKVQKSKLEKYKIEREDLDNNPAYETNRKNITPLSKDYVKKNTEGPVKFGPKLKKSGSTKTNQSAERLKKLLYEDEDLSDEKSNVKENKSIKNEIHYKSEVDIEIFTNVKSNTALASTALFLTTGIFVAKAKEEMKWVKTKLNIKDDRIIIKKPYSYHKYKDFHQFKVDQEDDYYLVYIVLNDEEMIIFRTKEKFIGEAIVDKINNLGLAYDM